MSVSHPRLVIEIFTDETADVAVLKLRDWARKETQTGGSLEDHLSKMKMDIWVDGSVIEKLL